MSEPARSSLVDRLGRRLRRGRAPAGPAAYDDPTVTVTSHLHDVHWVDEHTLHVAGWVYAPGTSVTPEDRPGLGVRLEGPTRSVLAEASMVPLTDVAVDEAADDPRHTYAAAAFEAELDLRPARDRGHGPWTLAFSLDTAQGPVTGPFTDRDVHGPAGALERFQAPGWRLAWSRTHGVLLHDDDGAGTVELPVPAEVVVTAVRADPGSGTLLVRGRSTLPTVALELRGPRQSVRSEPVDVAEGAFTTSVPLLAPGWDGEPRPLVTGAYVLHVLDEDDASPDAAPEASMSPTCLATIGELVEGPLLHARVGRTRKDGVRIDVRPPLRPDERGAFAQLQLRLAYRAMPPVAEQSLERPVSYYECYYGVSCTDSARAIQDELVRRDAPVRHVWGVADLSVPVPTGSEAVLRLSREWWTVLGQAERLTVNAGLPAGLVRRPGQVLVQTWHGTPLKLLGHDRPVNHDKEGFEDSTSRYVSRWDHLLAGNPHSAEVFRRAWFYQGSVLELGYPRNDALAAPDPDVVRRTRQRLGLPDGARVVLYAPTWRDGQRVMPDLLDLDRLADLLPDHVFLVRGHMNIRRWQHRPSGAAVLDVTTYPEIDDLFLVADVAVTDYSSIMFDFSVTRKPMLFFVPDLEDYRDRRRGVYFDLGATAPGPLLGTTDEVAEALRDLTPAAYASAWGSRYDAWVARFNPLDDGHAAARVVDAVYRFD